MTYAFPPAFPPSLPIQGDEALYPIHRVFCVGRNFADHAAEMGAQVDRATPVYFTKSAHHVALAVGQIPMAQGTADYHHELELVVALGPHGIFGCALGLDMTRRDLQAIAKEKRRPWDTGKDVEASALITPIASMDAAANGTMTLEKNGTMVQSGDLGDMIWSVPEIIANLGTFYTLRPGDLIFMGTPAGVGPVQAGDRLVGNLPHVGKFDLRFT